MMDEYCNLYLDIQIRLFVPEIDGTVFEEGPNKKSPLYHMN